MPLPHHKNKKPSKDFSDKSIIYSTEPDKEESPRVSDSGYNAYAQQKSKSKKTGAREKTAANVLIKDEKTASL